jgi:hypothetical protein
MLDRARKKLGRKATGRPEKPVRFPEEEPSPAAAMRVTTQ